jgi:uncharacterized iron-regulated membrane protein
LRNLLLKVHLYLGLVAAIFLVILGLTGAIMAFEGDIDHWMHRSLWYVNTGARTLPEEDLVRAAQQRFAPARVAAIQILRQPDLVQVMQMTDRAAVYVNPYDGSIQGRTTGPSRTQRTLGVIHQFHLRLVTDPRASSFAAAGKKIISIAGLFLVVLVPTGFTLWWRTRRASIKFGGSWFRMCFDAHHAMGIYAALFLFIAAVTGVLIGFDFGEEAIYAMTKSGPPDFRTKPPQSTPQPGAKPIGADRAAETARGAMPDATVAVIQLPLNPKAAYNVLMRVPEETSEAVHSVVTVDQYSGQVLKVRNFKTDSMGYRIIRFNRSIHTGDVLGTPTHIIVSLSSLLLVAMVLTGIVIWWKKLAV